MSNFAMPFLIFNLGGEMMYILQQRLSAQKIALDKSKKVLQDVVKHMFQEQFLRELIKPQPLYSDASVRQIFEKLAHSSIMRLSASSMGKLYDLMIMGVKYNIMCCSQPQELVQFTFNHLDEMENIVGKDDDSQSAIEARKCLHTAIGEITEITKKLTLYDFFMCRQALLEFVQERNIKVSIFLTCEIQSRTDGSFSVPVCCEYPLGFERPGTVKYFENGLIRETTECDSHPMKNYSCNCKNHLNTEIRTSCLAVNYYSAEVKAKKETREEKVVEEEAPTEQSAEKVVSNYDSTKELNYLASLIGGAKESHKDSFKVNLFTSFDYFDNGEEDMDEGMAQKTTPQELLQFDCRSSKKTSTIDFEVNNSKVEEENDLLDLMDQ
ncbi:hypothetical protein ABK040_004778 [Willaertia magna]